MHIYLSSTPNARRIKIIEKQIDMRYLSKRLTDYVIKTGMASDELHEVYQYGFQIGIEILTCFLVCLSISIYLHMMPEFVVSTIIFMLLRSYAGGLHLHSFVGCFICSVLVQSAILIISAQYIFTGLIAWFIISSGTFLILIAAPVENINRELDLDEKKHCKEITKKVLIGIIVYSVGCSLAGKYNIVSLVALTILVVLFSQYIGIVMYKFEKAKQNNIKN